MRYWEKDIETLAPAELKRVQLQRLRNTLEGTMRAPFYSSLYTTNGKYAGKIRHIEDLQEMPFTTKQQLRDNFPYGFLSLPKKDIIRLHSSSGTTGNPTVVFHNRHDIHSWANLMARSLFCAGVRDTDVFQNIVGYGLFTGGDRKSTRLNSSHT